MMAERLETLPRESGVYSQLPEVTAWGTLLVRPRGTWDCCFSSVTADLY